MPKNYDTHFYYLGGKTELASRFFSTKSKYIELELIYTEMMIGYGWVWWCGLAKNNDWHMDAFALEVRRLQPLL